MINLAWLIPVLPLTAFAIIGLFTLRKHGLSSALALAASVAATPGADDDGDRIVEETDSAFTQRCPL